MNVFLKGSFADKNEKPSPRETDPTAMGSDVRSAMNVLFLLAQSIAIDEARLTAATDDAKATIKLFTTARMLVPAPEVERLAISVHALRVKTPSLLKKDLWMIESIGGAMNRRMIRHRANARRLFLPCVFFRWTFLL